MRRAAVLICSVVLLAGGGGGALAQTQPLSALHDALNLNRTQEDAWRTFQASAAMDNAGQARAQQTAALAPRLPTPRRLALIRAQMQADLADFDRSSQAVLEFYNTLTPAQQRTFDERTAATQQPGRR